MITMSTAAPPVDLELSIRRSADGYTLDARMRDSLSLAYNQLASGQPLHIDPVALLAASGDAHHYGTLLGQAVFSEPAIWTTVAHFAAGRQATLRLRLIIDSSAAELHALRWECLCAPDGSFIGADGQVPLLRYVPTNDLQPVLAIPRDTLRVLVASASPSDSARYGLAPFNADAEVQRVEAALAEAPWLTTLAPHEPAGRATPQRLAELLRKDCDVLYLACHGTLAHGQPVLWLEDDEGKAQRLAGDELERQLGALGSDRRPLLVVLAACHTAGSDDPLQAMAALGPCLARAGVLAVIAMQGFAPAELVAQFVPVLLSELLRDGRIDRAVAMARSAVPLSGHWWLPVLYTRVEDGSLWPQPPVAPQAPLTVYLSSEDPDSPSVADLRLHLNLRGLRVVPPAGAAPTFRPAALDGADLCVLHISPERIRYERDLTRDSDTLDDVRTLRGMPVLVVRDGVSRRDLKPLLNPADRGWDEQALEPGAGAAVAAAALALALTTPSTNRVRRSVLRVGLSTLPPGGEPTPLDLLLNWESLYTQAYPTPEVWRATLLPAIADLRRILGDARVGATRIELTAKARLSTGVALGYAFREVSGTSFRVRQGPVWWQTAPHNLHVQPLVLAEPIIVSDHPDLSVELNITQVAGKLSTDVNHYLATSGLRVGRRLRLTQPLGSSNQIGSRQAQAIASHVRTLMQDHTRPGGTIHLFLAVPFGLALMIGWHLNTLTPVQCYEMPEGGKVYTPACRIETL